MRGGLAHAIGALRASRPSAPRLPCRRAYHLVSATSGSRASPSTSSVHKPPHDDQPDPAYSETPQARSLRAFGPLGLRTSVVAGMRNFPQVNDPSAIQREFIPAVVRGEADVFIRDGAGSGKSFGLVVSLLSKQRAGPLYVVDEQSAQGKKRAITSVMVVPHTSLGAQLVEWVRTLTPPDLHAHLPSVVQFIARGEENADAHARMLAADPPHILVATPGALLDLWRAHPDALQPRTLRAIVLDEADYLLGFGQHSAKTPENATGRPKHPPDVMVFMDELFAARPKCVALARYAGQDVGRVPLQVVLASATFPLGLRNFVVRETDWLKDSPRALVKVGFNGPDEGDVDEEEVPAGITLGGPGLARPGLVKHHCLVVRRDGEMGDLELDGKALGTDKKRKGVAHNVPLPRGASSPAPELLECVAACIALDVEKLALLVLPDGASVGRTVGELQNIGVNALPLDLTAAGQEAFLKRWEGAMTLLVCTRATTRGIDLPVSHVFVLGVPENAFVYRHLAGRVGRRGTEGRVVGVVSVNADEEARMRDIYRRLSIVPEKYEPGGE
ncbi:P-loop containing nucleoside triphosphate hydrolase protein [Auricularia subglabra TFB-10046 SS5]|nr:P-loop containing nucleoside triphosphate hydrolase protein [Auricularia subglabra TFB-10046 SS5]